MKIAFVSDAIYPYNKGGKEKRLYEISTRLAEMGHDVHIYCMHWWDTPEKMRQEHGVTLHAISKLYPLYNGDKRSVKEGVMFGLACLKLIREQWDVIDVDHMPFFPIYSAWLVCLLKRKKLYGTWHEALTRQDWTNYMGKAGYIAYMIEHLSIKLPYTITAASPQTKELLETEHDRTKRVNLVGSGIDSQLIASVEPADIKCDVLYVGRLVKDKNVAMLIEAIALIRQQKPDVRCIIVGQGIEQDNLQALIHKLGLEANIIMIGQLPQASDVYAYMKAAKVFALPSVREGFGIVVLEALACGIPVITVDTPANAAKALVNSRTGTVVQLDVHALANATLFWLTTTKKSKFPNLTSNDWNSLVQKLVVYY